MSDIWFFDIRLFFMRSAQLQLIGFYSLWLSVDIWEEIIQSESSGWVLYTRRIPRWNWPVGEIRSAEIHFYWVKIYKQTLKVYSKDLLGTMLYPITSVGRSTDYWGMEVLRINTKII